MQSHEIKEFSQTEAGLNELELAYRKVPDLGTKEGYQLCHQGIHRLRTVRVTLDKLRLRLNADDQARIKYRNGEAKRITARITSLEDPLKSAKKAVDDEKARIKAEAQQAEEERKAELEGRVFAIADIGEDAYTPNEIQSAIDEVAKLNPASYLDFKAAAFVAKNKTVDKLTARLARAQQQEKERQARIVEEQKEIGRMRVEREQLAAAQAQHAAIAEELRKRHEKEQAEIDKQRREIEEAQAEQQRIKDEEIQRIEAEEKAKADEKHRLEAELLADVEDKLAQARARKEAKENKEKYAVDAGFFMMIAGKLDEIRLRVEDYQSAHQSEKSVLSATASAWLASDVSSSILDIIKMINASAIVQSQDDGD